MTFNKVLMDFENVKRIERTAEFSYKSHRYMCCVSVNPNNNNVLFSLFLDRKPIMLNRVVIVGEPIIDGFGAFGFEDILDSDFVFMPVSSGYRIGDPVNYKDLGSVVFLYHITKGESDES